MFKNTYFYFHCAHCSQMSKATNYVWDRDSFKRIEAGKNRTRSLQKNINLSIYQQYDVVKKPKQALVGILGLHNFIERGYRFMFEKTQGLNVALQEKIEKHSLFNVFNV